MTRLVSWLLGLSLTASTIYLLALLFGYMGGLGRVRRHHAEAASYAFVVASAVVAFRRAVYRRPPIPPPGSRAWAVPLAGFIAASCALYGHTLRFGLFSDDFVLAAHALDGR